jgi:translocation and assembly module TamB
MKRHPFLIFTAIVGSLITGVIWYIQSPSFAHTVKNFISRKMPSDLGIDGDFKEFAIRLIPPGISIKEPKVTFKKENILNVPSQSSVVAERVDFTFQLFQMFSANVRVHEVAIVNGNVHLFLNENPFPKKQPKKKNKPGFHWEELLQIKTDAIRIQNTNLEIESTTSNLKLEFKAESLRLEQDTGKLSQIYDLEFDLSSFKANYPKSWVLPSFANSIERIKARATINSQGISIQEVNLKVTGIQSKLNGQIKGDILNPKDLFLETEIEAEGSLDKFLEIVKEKLPDLGGDLSFKGKVKGNLLQLSDTLEAEGSLNGKKVNYKNWNIDQLKADVSWISLDRGGDLSVQKVFLKESEASDSGRIEAGPFKVRLQNSLLSSFSVPVRIQNSHIHWLGSLALADVFPMDFKLSALVDVHYHRDKSWSVKTKITEGMIDRFKLTNQRLGLTKPMRRVLDIQKLAIDEALLAIDPTGVTLENVNLRLPRSKLHATGKVDGKTGYDLKIQSQIDLEDFGILSENEIRGKGEMRTHVHGPSSRAFLDFDVDLKDALYLNLNLGSLKGRITWDDDPQHILFTNVALEKGRTSYRASGVLDVGKNDSAKLKFDITRGDLRDFVRIFDYLIKDLWWFPSALNGPMTGSIDVTGGLSLDDLKVSTNINGVSWEFYGERFKSVQFVGGYDRGKYYLDNIKILKKRSEVLGNISFDARKSFKWNLKGQAIQFSDFDYLAKLDIPVRGLLSFESEGQGKSGSIESLTKGSLSSLSVKGISKPDSEVNIKTQQGGIKIDGKALGNQGKLLVDYNWNSNILSSFSLKMNQLDFSVPFYLLNPRLILDPTFNAQMSGDIKLNFHSGKIELSEGQINIDQMQLEKSGTSFKLLEPMSISLNQGTVPLRVMTIKNNAGESQVRLAARAGVLDAKITGEMDLSLLEIFIEQVEKASGPIHWDFLIGGELKKPVVLGKMKLENTSLKLTSLESPFEALTGNVTIKQNLINFNKIESDFAGGRFTLLGKSILYADKFPELAIKAEFNGNKLKVYPFQFIKVTGVMDVTGDGNPYLAKGNLNVQSGLTREKFTGPKVGSGLRALKYAPREGADGSHYSRLKLDIDVTADKEVFIQNDLFNAEAKGKLKIVNTLVAPRLLGTADIIQGRMIFKDRSFQIQSASAVFDNPTVINPKFNLTASTDVNEFKVQLYVTGSQDNMRVDLSSTPVMPEQEILSLLALGFTQQEVGKMSSGDRAIIEQGGAASLILHSLDFNREVEDKTGIKIQLDESVNTQMGTSIFRPQSPTEGAAPKIIVRKNIGKRLRLVGGSTVGIGSNSQKEVNAELQVTPGFSVIGVWENFETMDTQNNSRTSYGLDLKVEKRFK